MGFEEHLAQAGDINISGADAAEFIIRDTTSLLKTTKPGVLVLLGDIKPGTGRITPHEWEQVPTFLEAARSACDGIVVVPGNHGGAMQRLVPSGVTMTWPAGMIAGGVLYTHGHAMPPDSFAHADEIVMGRPHPVFFSPDSVADGQRVWVSAITQKRSIFPSRDGEITVTAMPSLNRHVGSTHRKRIGAASQGRGRRSNPPIIERMMPVRRAAITTLDGTIICDESMIDSVM